MWALLASGSTGGVRTVRKVHKFDQFIIPVADRVLAFMLSTRYTFLADDNNCLITYFFPPDVVKSRIQLRATPPTGTPVQYIAHELKAIVQEAGV